VKRGAHDAAGPRAACGAARQGPRGCPAGAAGGARGPGAPPCPCRPPT
jgi:hypothetical protein